MKKISILLVIIMATFAIQAQVAINKDGTAPSASTILHVKNTSGSQFLFSDTDGNITLQSHESADVYVGKAYIDFGNSNGGYHSVGKIGKFASNSNLGIYSDIGVYFHFTSGVAHRLTGYGLALGKTVPTQMLDVNGNGTFTGDLDAGGDITANGDLWGTNGYLTDNLEVGGNGTFSGKVAINTTPTGARQFQIEAGSNIGTYIHNTGGYAGIYVFAESADAFYASKGGLTLNSGSITMKDGNQAVNNMMVSDANGKATWENVNDGVRTRVIRQINGGASTEVVVWSHPAGIEVRFDPSTETVTVENKSGTTNNWVAVIKGGATGYNTIETCSYKERNIVDGQLNDNVSFDLGSNSNGWFEVIANDRIVDNDGFILHVNYFDDDLNGMVQYWDN